ncbi:centromere protein R [Dromiciops gliroides]|uniref:centromere protein R n=1 Tax=Dromiciops gliroides TaxID=33562 RepID=UPI001CC696E2|nr:centromere protein R [Dromiciops gliroides]
MPVKRSLKLDLLLQENSPKSRQTRRQFIASYSPTTGTRQISPRSSPQNQKGREFRNGPPNEQMALEPTRTFPRRGQPRAEGKDDIMILLYKIDRSLEKFTETWQSLKHLQALVGRPELESLIGLSCTSLDLKSEVQKTRELMMKVRQQKQLKKKTPKHFPRVFTPVHLLASTKPPERHLSGFRPLSSVYQCFCNKMYRSFKK